MSVLEKDIEKAIVKKAKALGCLALKINGLGQRSWPDRLFIRPDGQVIWIEIKRPGGVLSEGQKAMIDELKLHNQIVYTCYSVDEAMLALKYSRNTP
jgi:hypothetical protein